MGWKLILAAAIAAPLIGCGESAPPGQDMTSQDLQKKRAALVPKDDMKGPSASAPGHAGPGGK